MARFVITRLLAQAPITYLYKDVAKALAKVRTLQRNNGTFTITDGDGRPMSVADLEALAAQS